MKKTLLCISLLLAMAMSLFAQKTAQIHRASNGFSGIIASSAFDITLKKGDVYNVIVTTDAEIVDRVLINIFDDNLTLSLQNGKSKDIRILHAEITMPTVSSITLTGACELNSDDTFTTENFTAALTGSSEMKINIRATSADLSLTGSSDLSMHIEANNINVTSAGSSDASLSGKTMSLNASCTGSSDLNAFDLETLDAVVVATGSSDIEVAVVNKLDISSSGSSNILYKGNPTVKISKSGSSSISKQ